MNIVNLLNDYQAYTYMSIVPEEIQNIVLWPALAIFILSFVFSIIYLIRENREEPGPLSNRAPGTSNLHDLKKRLLSSYSTRENTEHLVSNLEDLKTRNIIDEEAYNRNRQEYDAIAAAAN